MNKIILVGRLTRDPEVRTISTGSVVTNITIAVNRNFRNKEGNVEADFINVVVFGKTAENVGKYCTKGSQIGVDGRLQTRSYDHQDGTKRYVTEVIADNVEFMGSRRDSESRSNNSFSSYGDNNSYVDIPSATPIDTPSFADEIDVSNDDPFKDFGSEVALSDDDLPF